MQLQQAEQEQPLRARTATLAVPASAEQAPALGRALALALEADKRAFQRAVTLLSSSRSDASEGAPPRRPRVPSATLTGGRCLPRLVPPQTRWLWRYRRFKRTWRHEVTRQPPR